LSLNIMSIRTSRLVWLALACSSVIIGIALATRAATEQVITRFASESEEAVALQVGTLERLLITVSQDLAYLARGRALAVHLPRTRCVLWNVGHDDDDAMCAAAAVLSLAPFLRGEGWGEGQVWAALILRSIAISALTRVAISGLTRAVISALARVLDALWQTGWGSLDFETIPTPTLPFSRGGSALPSWHAFQVKSNML
jgi:hypothetical protein